MIEVLKQISIIFLVESAAMQMFVKCWFHDPNTNTPSVVVYLFFHAAQGNEETELIKDLFKDYNKKIRPVIYPEQKVEVQIKLTLTNLISLVSRFTTY